MATDGSVAVWSEFRTGANDCDAQIHFNYWRIARGRFIPIYERLDFIEIGIQLSNPGAVEKVQIYLPGVDIGRIEDCGPRFQKPDIAQGIFNEQLTCNVSNQPPRVDLMSAGEPQDCYCRVHIFLMDEHVIDQKQLKREPYASGALLTITRQALDEVATGLAPNVPVYFRLRAFMPTGKRNPFIKRIAPADRYFQTGYSVVDYLDFRLNEARSLPTQIESLMRKCNSRVPVKLIAFLTAVPVRSDVTTASWEKSHKKRLLEDALWRDYGPNGIPKGMSVYHWREIADVNKKELTDFSGFVKMQTRLVIFRVALIALLIPFLAGIFGNLLASWIWDDFKMETSKKWDFRPPAEIEGRIDAPTKVQPFKGGQK